MMLLSIEHVTAIRTAATAIVSGAPAESTPNTTRRAQTHEVRSAAGGGGRMRARLLDYASIECAAATAQVQFLVDGFCDLLRSAAARDGALNTAAAAVVARSALEISGQVLWLLDSAINGVERGRRYLTWRFDDLKQLRYMSNSSSGDDEVDAAAAQHTDGVERELLEWAAAAGWDAKAQRVLPTGVEPARLLADDGRPAKLPGPGTFATLAAMADDAYKILSVSAHGQRYGTQAAISSDPTTGETRMSGSLIDSGLLVGWACAASALPALALARWNGLDGGRLVSLIAPLATAADSQG